MKRYKDMYVCVCICPQKENVTPIAEVPHACPWFCPISPSIPEVITFLKLVSQLRKFPSGPFPLGTASARAVDTEVRERIIQGKPMSLFLKPCREDATS